MASTVDFSKDAFVVITGASKGIGRSISIEIAKLLSNNSALFLLARSEDGLNETKSLVLNENKKLTVVTAQLDLSKPNLQSFEQIIKENVEKVKNIDIGIIFHNAGHVGSLDVTTELTDLDVWKNYFELNLFSAILLNTAFVKELHKKTKHLFVINITSMCGRKPFVNMSMYGSAKAARELFFKVFATEEKDVAVLNYSPGPVDTNMIEEVITNLKDPILKTDFEKMRDNKTILTPQQTVTKLLEILKQGAFQSGDVIDYFDRT